MTTYKHPLIAEPFKLIGAYLIWRDALIISDLHIGKTMHFRKAGVAIPARARDKDYERLLSLLNTHQPAEVFFLGDLFHSHSNLEVEEFAFITGSFPNTTFHLIAGNHDILDAGVYRSLDMHVDQQVRFGNLIMTHEPLMEIGKVDVNLFGHLHPAVQLKGKGRQHLVLPCFHFGAQRICVPAFGSLTGYRTIRPVKGDKVFAIAKDNIIEVL